MALERPRFLEGEAAVLLRVLGRMQLPPGHYVIGGGLQKPSTRYDRALEVRGGLALFNSTLNPSLHHGRLRRDVAPTDPRH